MGKPVGEAEIILTERFGKDTVVALATIDNYTPYVRYVNAYYEKGAFMLSLMHFQIK